MLAEKKTKQCTAVTSKMVSHYIDWWGTRPWSMATHKVSFSVKSEHLTKIYEKKGNKAWNTHCSCPSTGCKSLLV